MNPIRDTLVSLTAVLLLTSAAPAAAAQPLTGTWQLHRSREPHEVQLRLWTDSQRDFESGNPIATAELGLSDARLAAPPSPARFALRREGGAFTFTGTLGNELGSGTFTFSPSGAFAAGLDSRGLHYDGTRGIMVAALVNLTLAYVDAIRTDGYPGVSFDTLLGFRALGVTRESIADLRSLFGTVSADDVMSATALHVTRSYVNELRAMGIGPITPQRAVTFKSLDITKAYLDELARSGFPDLPPDEIVSFKAMHIDAAYLRHLAAHGFTHLTAEQVIQLKAANL